jgi:hypothetical protein
MKQITGWICLVLFCAGAVWVEYQMALRLGAAFVLVAGTCALAVICAAVYSAPEGHEEDRGFHILPRRGPSRPARHLQPLHRRVRREWT